MHTPISVVASTWLDDPRWAAPLSIQLVARLSQAVSYYKLIGTLSYSNEEWGADYPKDRPRPASGRWVLVQGKYYAHDDREDSWARMWHFAARGYAAANMRYHVEVRFGMHQYWRLGDIVEVIHEDEALNVSLARTSGASAGTNQKRMSRSSSAALATRSCSRRSATGPRSTLRRRRGIQTK